MNFHACPYIYTQTTRARKHYKTNMDHTVMCSNCASSIDKSASFHKSVIDLKYHPNEYREKCFCTTKCISVYIQKNKKEEVKDATPCRIYNWGGGMNGF